MLRKCIWPGEFTTYMPTPMSATLMRPGTRLPVVKKSSASSTAWMRHDPTSPTTPKRWATQPESRLDATQARPYTTSIVLAAWLDRPMTSCSTGVT